MTDLSWTLKIQSLSISSDPVGLFQCLRPSSLEILQNNWNAISIEPYSISLSISRSYRRSNILLSSAAVSDVVKALQDQSTTRPTAFFFLANRTSSAAQFLAISSIKAGLYGFWPTQMSSKGTTRAYSGTDYCKYPRGLHHNHITTSYPFMNRSDFQTTRYLLCIYSHIWAIFVSVWPKGRRGKWLQRPGICFRRTIFPLLCLNKCTHWELREGAK